MHNTVLNDNWQKKKIQKSKQHQLKAFDSINDLIVRERHGKTVTLVDGTVLKEFMSCSYLGLDQDPRIVAAAISNIGRCGVNFAIARTRMRVESFVVLENLLNQIFNGFCVSFTSLHLTHLGMIPLIASGEMPSYPLKNNRVLFIVDRVAHASLQINRGLMQQFGKIVMVDFKNIDAIEQQYKLAYLNQRTPISFLDGIGSMGGLAPIKALFELTEKYDGYAYIDDAHGISVYGEKGSGYVLKKLGFFHPRLMLGVSLSKGFGANGAAIVVPTLQDQEMIRRYCIPYLFSNPLPLAIVDSAIAAANIHLSDEIYFLQNQLQKYITYFDILMKGSTLEKQIINYGTSSPVRGILIGNELSAIETTIKLRECGIGLTAAMYPTVAKGKSMLRITISADHSLDDISLLCRSLIRLIPGLNVITGSNDHFLKIKNEVSVVA
jgi:7-keto-8-aminopelargonate synthetase-like enzyme